VEQIREDAALTSQCRDLADEVEQALKTHAIVHHATLGKIYAYEVDGYGNYYCIDDGNVPSLLSLPYIGAVKAGDLIYKNTRRLILSNSNPYYCQGKAASGPGGPHVGMGMIWPLGLIMEGLTSTTDQEIRRCLITLQRTHAGTGFMHEAFSMDDPKIFTRPWFAWANTIFGELILKTFYQNPNLLNE
jgi:meiotically up-regulated gene 157 (Mug157) protein